MKALVIGAGYVGARVANAWTAAGHTVHVLTRSPERAAAFEEAGLRPVIGDVTNSDSLRDLPDYDVLLYAVGFDRTAGHDRQTVFVGGVENVLRSISGRVGRFLYVSTAGVYGQSNGEWVDEGSVCEPATEGGRCCLTAESRIRDAFPTRHVVLRLAGIYGPGRLLRRAEPLQRAEPIAGRPDAWLNLIHVDDAVTTVLAVAESSDPVDTYIVSDDEPMQRCDYFGLLAELLEAPPPTFDATAPTRHGAGGVNKRLTNRRLVEQLGVTLDYPTYREGLRASVVADQ